MVRGLAFTLVYMRQLKGNFTLIYFDDVLMYIIPVLQLVYVKKSENTILKNTFFSDRITRAVEIITAENASLFSV